MKKFKARDSKCVDCQSVFTQSSPNKKRCKACQTSRYKLKVRGYNAKRRDYHKQWSAKNRKKIRGYAKKHARNIELARDTLLDCGYTRTPHCKGYITIAGKLEHILVAERMISRRLMPGEVVHHKDENRTNNNPCNLIVFPNEAAHKELHRKMRIQKAGGDPSTHSICCVCGLQPLSAFGIYKTSKHDRLIGRPFPRCHKCHAAEERNRRQKNFTAQS